MVAVEEGTVKHGNTKRSFEYIATAWATYIGHVMANKKRVELTPFDVANMMIMVKQARSIYGHADDNQVDIAGYAALAAVLNPTERLGEEIEKALNGDIKHADNSVQ
jgi:hypothetical protein